MAGCLLGGVATDRLVRSWGLVWGRRAPCIFSYGGAAVSYGLCFLMDAPWAIVSLLVISSFLGDFGLGPLWCTYQDLGGPYSGTVLGVGNMCGNIGAAIGISLVPRLAAEFGWSASFALSAGAYAIGALAWLVIDPRRTVYRTHAAVD
jgi:MFS family permease